MRAGLSISVARLFIDRRAAVCDDNCSDAATRRRPCNTGSAAAQGHRHHRALDGSGRISGSPERATTATDKRPAASNLCIVPAAGTSGVSLHSRLGRHTLASGAPRGNVRGKPARLLFWQTNAANDAMTVRGNKHSRPRHMVHQSARRHINREATRSNGTATGAATAQRAAGITSMRLVGAAAGCGSPSHGSKLSPATGEDPLL
jgi:hypothetical protein